MITSHHVIQYNGMSYHGMSDYYIISPHITSHHITSHHIISYPCLLNVAAVLVLLSSERFATLRRLPPQMERIPPEDKHV